ncbi:probable bifunctional methylthioribulose-1-phosphate dehydratase/enolase-phosphatase E1 [Tanacetum coccineum]
MEFWSYDPNLYSKCAEGKNGGRRYITHMEMIKGIQGHGYYDEFAVPIIGNVARERELTESLALAMMVAKMKKNTQVKENVESCQILVRYGSKNDGKNTQRGEIISGDNRVIHVDSFLKILVHLNYEDIIWSFCDIVVS